MTNICEVTDGLQLWLDASSFQSYPETGTTWYDLTDNHYDSILSNSITYNTSDRGYFIFDNTNDYIDTNQSLSSESFSVGAFFRTSSVGIKMILSKETASGSPWNYRIWMNGGQLIADIAQGVTQSSLSSPLTNYNDGQWHYVMFTRDDSTWVLYVDGIQVTTKADNFTGSIINAQELWIGRSAFTGESPTGSYQYYGNISVVMIYNRVLSLSEISQNYSCLLSRFNNPIFNLTEISSIKAGNNNILRAYMGYKRIW
jgi:hypothetical protein